MPLSHDQFKTAFEALRDAYPARADLELLLALELRQVYVDLTPLNIQKSEYLTILQKANAQGWAEELMLAAHRDQPQNDVLANFADGLSTAKRPLVAPPPAPDDAAQQASADALDQAKENALQRLVSSGESAVDAVQLLERLSLIGCRTGAIEVGGAHQGTCLLVGPDVVITNHHVIAPLIVMGAGGATARFDRFVNGVGLVQDGWTMPLHADWNIFSCPPGAADETDDPDDLPAPEELDFALVRLSEAIDQRPCPQNANGEPRGFAALSNVVGDTPKGNIISIIQHPAGAPRQMTFGNILSFDSAQTRMRYSANTKRGSSGSPVTDSKGHLIALHHAGDPNFAQMAKYNQGIPAHLILARIIAEGLEGAVS